MRNVIRQSGRFSARDLNPLGSGPHRLPWRHRKALLYGISLGSLVGPRSTENLRDHQISL